FIQSAFFCSTARPSSLMAEESRSKSTSPSGRSAFSCSSVFWRKTSSSDSGFGGSGCAGGGGGGGGGGGAVSAGGGGGGGAGAGAFLPQPVSPLATMASDRATTMRATL